MKKLLYVIAVTCFIGNFAHATNGFEEEYGKVQTIYSDGKFEIRYLDAPRAGSVSGRVLGICDNVEPSQPFEIIKQAVDWANADKNLVVEVRVHGEGTCIDSIKLKSK